MLWLNQPLNLLITPLLNSSPQPPSQPYHSATLYFTMFIAIEAESARFVSSPQYHRPQQRPLPQLQSLTVQIYDIKPDSVAKHLLNTLTLQ
jgi:hypothetical protein